METLSKRTEQLYDELVAEVKSDVIDRIKADPGNTLFGRPLSEIQRLIHEEEERKGPLHIERANL